MIRVACAIVKNDKDEWLMVQRAPNMPHPLTWEFPGGKLLSGESAKDAVVREIDEELDLQLKALREFPEIYWQYPGKKIALVPVICEIRSGEVHLKEHIDIKWLGLKQMKEMDVLEADRLIIQQLEGEQ